LHFTLARDAVGRHEVGRRLGEAAVEFGWEAPMQNGGATTDVGTQ
jgi:hypothetical protein